MEVGQWKTIRPRLDVFNNGLTDELAAFWHPILSLYSYNSPEPNYNPATCTCSEASIGFLRVFGTIT